MLQSLSQQGFEITAGAAQFKTLGAPMFVVIETNHGAFLAAFAEFPPDGEVTMMRTLDRFQGVDVVSLATFWQWADANCNGS